LRTRWKEIPVTEHLCGFPFTLLEMNERALEKIMRTFSNNTIYKSAIGVMLVALFMLVWLSLGVGIIGADGDPANLMYFAVVAVAIIGAIITRLKPAGMARVLMAMAYLVALIAAIAIFAKLGMPWSPPLEILGLTFFFIAMFAISAWLFIRAAFN